MFVDTMQKIHELCPCFTFVDGITVSAAVGTLRAKFLIQV